jgi:methionyl-tRNA synthetase
MKTPYYISTAIAYASATPHIGNVYEIILADSIARFKRLEGYDVYFQTGTDEHGLKIEQRAQTKEMSPQAYVDEVSATIKRIFDSMHVSYDYFIRTTSPFHQQSVQKIFDYLLQKGDIYLGKYQGYYSVSEEAYILEKDIVDGKGPNGDTLIWMEEEVYFFDMKKYQQKLLKHIEENTTFIAPESRKNEMVQNFLLQPLPDLSISRTSFKWGIKVLNDPHHVIYVWMDALSNYITGLGYEPGVDTDMMKKYWPADVHLIGKDILRFHTIYWPIFLMALDLPLPKQVFGHPWILIDKGKMSKSMGNVMYTDFLLKHFSVDIIRYYVLHEIPYAQDGNMTYELIIERNNTDLSNTIGNLVNRTIGMVHKYKEGKLNQVMLDEVVEMDLKQESLKSLPKMKQLMDQLKVSDALEVVVQLSRNANKYIDLTEPWVLNKDETKQERLDHVLYHLMETIRFIAVLLQPFMPETARKIHDQLGGTELSFESLETFGVLSARVLDKPTVLFERFDAVKKLEEIIKDQS